jgi:hypothetical protein
VRPGRRLAGATLLALAPCVGGLADETALSASVLRGRITSQGAPLAGVEIVVTLASGLTLGEGTSDAEGRFVLSGLPAGDARLSARFPGLAPLERTVDLPRGRDLEVDLEMPYAAVAERVEVAYAPRADSLAATLGPREELQGLALERLPSGEGTVEDALVTLPGVVRASGSLSIRGGRPTQSGMQLGSMMLTDPATGEARLRVPVDAVASVEVLPSPAAAEYGRFTSGVVVLHPQGGGDQWRLGLRNFDPSLRLERGAYHHVLGVRSFAPRLAVQGPLVPGRLFLSQSLQYRYTLSEVQSRPQDELSLQEYLSSVTRLDFQAGPTHQVGALLTVFPEEREHVNLGTFNPPETTYDQRTAISNASLTDTAALGPSAVLTSSLHAGRHGLWLGPPEDGTLVLRPEENAGRYFNRQDRHATALQWVETLSLARHGRRGERIFLLGFDALRVAFDGGSASRPVEVRRLDGTLARRVTFDAPARQSVTSTDLALFARGRWRPAGHLQLELGLRLDRDGVLRRSLLSSRLGASLEAGGGRLVLRGGVGLFGERTPSLVGAFTQLEARTEERYAADGVTRLAATRYAHETADGLVPARSVTASAECVVRLAPTLQLRAGVLGRDGRYEPVVEPLGEGDAGRLRLSTDGESRYRELEVGLRYTPRRDAEASVSWVRSRSEADLNAFSALFGTARAPVIGPNAYGPSPVDVPDRLVARASARLGPSWYATGLVDWRRGLPWSTVDAALDYAGPRTGGRFPTAALLDVAVERRFVLGKWEPWLGVGVVNALDSYAPRDVQANLTAPDYGAFYDAAPRRLQLVLRVGR